MGESNRLRQNYVTNNYALNMTDLANATKIAASQAAQSGIDISEMTAALATMISTTQQGGEQASRALRGKRAICTIALYRCESIIAQIPKLRGKIDIILYYNITGNGKCECCRKAERKRMMAYAK